MTDALKKSMDAVLEKLGKKGWMCWGFALNDEGDLAAFCNQDWNEPQICAATVEAIAKLDPNFVKEA